MTTAKPKIPEFVLLIIIVIGLYLAYEIVIFLIKAFVYLGFNLFFFTDNLLKINQFNPVLSWAIFGLLMGTIVGVIVAIKKFRLSKLLILYPISVVVVFVLIMSFINKPASYNGHLNIKEDSNKIVSTQDILSNVSIYTVLSDVVARKGMSIKLQRAFTLRKGTEVEIIQNDILDKSGAPWASVRFMNDTGYVKMKFIRFSRYENK